MVTGKPVRSGFDGYEKLSLGDADKIVRQMLENKLADLADKVHACSEKARSEGREKLLSEVETIARRLVRIREMTAFHEGSYMSPYLKEKILKVDADSLNQADGRLEGLIEDAISLITELSCAEKDLYIISKFSSMSTILRNYEAELAGRNKLLRQELKH